MTIWTDRSEVGYWIDLVFATHFAERLKVMDVNETLTQAPKLRLEIE